MLPFCHVTLKGQKPPPAGYPKEINTIGDRLRKRRLDLGLRQKDVANLVGVDETTVYNWEGNRTKPATPHEAHVMRFLGQEQ